MGIISVEHMDRLYWLGRYTERTYTTTRIFEHSYDKMIDFQPETYHKFCDRLDIPDIYPDKETRFFGIGSRSWRKGKERASSCLCDRSLYGRTKRSVTFAN